MVNSKAATLEEIERQRAENSFKFRPTISRSPVNRTEEEGPLHERLFSESNKLKEARQKRKEAINNMRSQQNIRTASTDILEDKKRYILGNVFEVLDSDNDGFISADECNFNALNRDLKEFFEPLVAEIKEKQASLDRENFIECALHLYKRLTPTQRNFLIEAGKVVDRSPQAENYTFSPTISQKSQELAKAVLPQGARVHERLQSREYSRDDKVEYFENMENY